MEFPSMQDIIATTSPNAAATFSWLITPALWLVGVAVAAILVGAIVKAFYGFLFYRQDDTWGANVKAYKRAGYEKMFDPVSGQMYYKKGPSRIWEKDI